MNKILFDKYLKDNNSKTNMLPNQLVLPEIELDDEEAPDLGMIQTQKVDFTYEPKGENYCYPSTKDFAEVFQDVCLESIYSKKCTIDALHKIKKICLEIKQTDIFKMKIDKELKYDEFRQEQQTITKNQVYTLKMRWVDDVVTCVEDSFKNEKEGWFNIKEANPSNYHIGKLKSFLTLVKVTMQDTLMDLIKANLNKYVDFIASFMPETTVIESITQVSNKYSDGYQVSSLGEEDFRKLHTPLFSVDLRIIDGHIKYSDSPIFFKGTVLKTFSVTLQELGTIQEIEGKILDSKFKKKIDSYLSCPKLPEYAPDLGDGSDPLKKYENQNVWVWDLYKRLESIMIEAILPLDEFLERFDKFKEILELSEEQLVKKYDGEHKKPIDFIFKEIEKFKIQSSEFESTILPKVQVGCFMVDCSDVKKKISEIFGKIQHALTEVIAKRASDTVQDIESKFLDISKQISQDPKDIEELTKLNEFIEIDLPIRIKKLQEETKEVMEIFDLLENAKFKMPEKELDLRWKIFKNPSDILKSVDDRDDVLNQKKKQLYEQMKSEQTDFKQMLD